VILNLNLKKNLFWLLITSVVLGVICGPVVWVLLGEKHFWSFLVGLLTGAVNTAVLLMAGDILMSTQKLKKGLLLLVVLKYPFLLAGLFWGLYILRLPPVTMVVGILVVFPAVFATLWVRNRESH
jgi:hypothetical protein